MRNVGLFPSRSYAGSSLTSGRPDADAHFRQIYLKRSSKFNCPLLISHPQVETASEDSLFPHPLHGHFIDPVGFFVFLWFGFFGLVFFFVGGSFLFGGFFLFFFFLYWGGFFCWLFSSPGAPFYPLPWTLDFLTIVVSLTDFPFLLFRMTGYSYFAFVFLSRLFFSRWGVRLFPPQGRDLASPGVSAVF